MTLLLCGIWVEYQVTYILSPELLGFSQDDILDLTDLGRFRISQYFRLLDSSDYAYVLHQIGVE